MTRIAAMNNLRALLDAVQQRKAWHEHQCDAKAAGALQCSNSWQRQAAYSRCAIDQLSWMESEIAKVVLHD